VRDLLIDVTTTSCVLLVLVTCAVAEPSQADSGGQYSQAGQPLVYCGYDSSWSYLRDASATVDLRGDDERRRIDSWAQSPCTIRAAEGLGLIKSALQYERVQLAVDVTLVRECPHSMRIPPQEAEWSRPGGCTVPGGKAGVQSRGRFTAAIAVVIYSAVVATQEQVPAPVPPTFRAGTALVQVSAVVTAGGKPVTDLRREEVQILDNGVPQHVVAFEYVDLTSVPGPAQRRDFVLVIDDLQIDPRNTKAAHDRSLAFLEALGAHDRLAIVNTSPHALVMQFSTNRAQARALVEKVRGQQGAPIPQVWEFNTRRLLQVLRSVGGSLQGESPERRAVLVLSEGRLPIEPESQSRDHALVDDYRGVVRQAALSNIVIYGVDPRGLLAPPPAPGTSTRDSVAVAGSTAEARAASSAARRYGAVGLLALSTGGQMIIDENAPDAGLPRLLQDSRQYYRLAYPQPDLAPGEAPRPRRIEVKVLRDGAKVRARSSYVPR
jgi:VWFA-related protein